MYRLLISKRKDMGNGIVYLTRDVDYEQQIRRLRAGHIPPRGGGAIDGIGETFSADPHTGTGSVSVPIDLPAERNDFNPELSLTYNTGNGNGPFGQGWELSIPGVSRKTSDGVPRYDDRDTFVLSGEEGLVPVETRADSTATVYRLRTEGLFARIVRHRDAENDYWRVQSTDGHMSTYGTPEARGDDPATVADPANPENAFAWRLTKTEDTFGNQVVYEYASDVGTNGPHRWDQPLHSRSWLMYSMNPIYCVI